MTKERKVSWLWAVVLGVASVAVFAGLYVYADNFVQWAQRTRSGEKMLFIIPILVAFLVSFVHGAFTGHFWEALGLKAATKK